MRDCIRWWLLSLAAGRRRNLVGAASCDIGVSTKRVRDPQCVNRVALISLMSDGVWPAAKKFKAGLLPSPECIHCRGGEEDLDHVLYRCPRWEWKRTALRLHWDELQASVASAKYCLLCPETASAARKTVGLCSSNAWPTSGMQGWRPHPRLIIIGLRFAGVWVGEFNGNPSMATRPPNSDSTPPASTLFSTLHC